MKAKTRQLAAAVAAAAILIAACLLAALLSRQSEEPGKQPAVILDAGKLKSVELTVGNEDVRLIKNGSFWYVDGNEDFPLDQDIPTAMEKLLSPLSAQRKVAENNGDPEKYGLGRYALKISFSGESQSGTLLIGDPCGAAPGWYFALGDESGVYLGDESLGTAFTFGQLNDLILPDPYPPVNAGSVVGMKTDTIEIIQTPTGKFGDPESRFCVSINGTLCMADDESAAELIALAAALEPERCVRFGDVDEGVLSEYGFKKSSIEISYTDSDSTLKSVVMIGAHTDDGHVYTMLEASKQICLVHADELYALSGDPEPLLSRRAFPVVPGKLASLRVKNAAGEFELERRTRTEEDENGLSQTIVEYFSDGRLADGRRADALTDTLASIEASSVALYDPPDDAEAVFSLSFSLTDGSPHEIKVCEGGGEFFVIHDGVCWQKLGEADAHTLENLVL